MNLPVPAQNSKITPFDRCHVPDDRLGYTMMQPPTSDVDSILIQVNSDKIFKKKYLDKYLLEIRKRLNKIAL